MCVVLRLLYTRLWKSRPLGPGVQVQEKKGLSAPVLGGYSNSEYADPPPTAMANGGLPIRNLN
jgi:hypothetical protein